MSYETILLDLDGTITDSAAGILGSYAATIRAMGHEPDPAYDMRFVIGPALGDVLPEVMRHYDDDRGEEAVAIYRRIYGETGVHGATVYDGMPELLASLTGKRVFVATAKRVDFARTMLNRFGLARHFAGIYGSVPGGGLDHKPELIAHILHKEAVDPATAVMAGDRRYDITGAHANGLRGIGVLWGYGLREELEQAGADALAETPAELQAMLGK